MKKRICATICAFAMARFGFLVVEVPTDVEASEITYSGTISEQTTAECLFLSTSGGTVQIKIDSGTELSNAKFLLPGNTSFLQQLLSIMQTQNKPQRAIASHRSE